MSDSDKSISDWVTEPQNSGLVAKVDRYDFLKELGAGAFGRVYLARDTVSDDLVAVKTIPSELSASANHMEGVKANFTLITKLIHENIANLKFLHQVENVKTFTSGIHIQKGEYLVIMEYVEGYTLKSWLVTKRQAEFSEAIRICREIAKGLDFAHSKKVIHRDIKPDNVMITVDDEVKILDFGLGAEVRSNMSQISNQVTSTSGTVPYMPPEQLTGKSQKATSDQYSLAVIFYEMIGGEVPFRSTYDTGDRVLIQKVVSEEDVEELEELTSSQNEVLLKALSKDKKDRYTSCVEFIDALEGKSQPVVNTPVVEKPSADEPSAVPVKKSKAPVLIVLFILLGIGGWFGFDAYQKGEAEKARLAKLDSDKKAEDSRLAALAQEKQSKITDYLTTAQSAFSQDDLSGASSALSELFSLDPDNKAGLSLQGKIAEKAGKKSVIPVKSEADFLASKLKSLSRSEGFGTALDKLDLTVLTAKDHYEAGNYAEALNGFVDYNGAAKKLLLEDKERQKYLLSKSTYVQSKSSINKSSLSTLASGHYKNLEQAESVLTSLETPGSFVSASSQLTKLQKLVTKVTSSDKASVAKSSYERSLLKPSSFYDKFGGSGWSKIKSLQLAAEKLLIDEDYLSSASKYSEAASLVASMHSSALAAESALLKREKISSLENKLRSATTDAVRLELIEELLSLDSRNELALATQKTMVVWKNEDLIFGTITMKPIPKGRFMMGSTNGDDDEKPVHEVELTQGFWMGETEVTQGLWESVMGTDVNAMMRKAERSSTYGVGSSHPIYYVSWEDSQEFIVKINRKYAGELPRGYKFSLPTEAQWEYACRAGTKGDYAGNLNSMAWYSDNADSRTHRVGTKQANAWGLYDMHGNVWEWCQDWYGDYQSGLQQNPGGPTSGANRVLRGGCWGDDASGCRSASRDGYTPGYRDFSIGFRLALVPSKF